MLRNKTLFPNPQLVNVQVSDMAGYSCVAENKVGTVEKLFSLMVQGRKPLPVNLIRTLLMIKDALTGVFSINCIVQCLLE